MFQQRRGNDPRSQPSRRGNDPRSEPNCCVSRDKRESKRGLVLRPSRKAQDTGKITDAEKAQTPKIAVSLLGEQELQGSGLKPFFWNPSKALAIKRAKAVAIKRAKSVALKRRLGKQSQRQVPKTPALVSREVQVYGANSRRNAPTQTS